MKVKNTNTNTKVYILDGLRTPFGSFGESLRDFTPVELSVLTVVPLLKKAKVNLDKIDQVIFANVIPSTPDTLYGGRHIALKSGMPVITPGLNINRLCGSGIEAITMAKNKIMLGDAQCILVSGSENMSMTPHLLYGSRFGTKYGSPRTMDLLLDALTDSFCQTSMGVTAENLAKEYSISREECDQYSVNSHKKAIKALEENELDDEIISIEHKKGRLTKDEHVRSDIDIKLMEKLKPSFVKNGVVTAASASGVVDGAASVLVVSEKFVIEHELNPLVEIVDSYVVGVEPTMMGIGPVNCIDSLLKNNGLKITDIDLFEINEAFAPQILACRKALNIDRDKLNIWGGAIALGHPLGTTGVRITHTLSRQLQRYKMKLGVASACIGGGQGISILLRKV